MQWNTTPFVYSTKGENAQRRSVQWLDRVHREMESLHKLFLLKSLMTQSARTGFYIEWCYKIMTELKTSYRLPGVW